MHTSFKSTIETKEN